MNENPVYTTNRAQRRAQAKVAQKRHRDLARRQKAMQEAAAARKALAELEQQQVVGNLDELPVDPAEVR